MDGTDSLPLPHSLFPAHTLAHPQLLKLASNLKQETSYPVWSQLSEALAEIKDLVTGLPWADSFSAFGRELYRASGQRLGWEAKESDSHMDRMLRPQVGAAQPPMLPRSCTGLS